MAKQPYVKCSVQYAEQTEAVEQTAAVGPTKVIKQPTIQLLVPAERAMNQQQRSV